MFWTLLITAFGCVFSISAFMLYLRLRTKAALTMCAGVATFWFGVGLSAFGPRSEKTLSDLHNNFPDDYYSVSSGSSDTISAQLTVVTSDVPLEYIYSLSMVLFVVGFALHALGHRR